MYLKFHSTCATVITDFERRICNFKIDAYWSMVFLEFFLEKTNLVNLST